MSYLIHGPIEDLVNEVVAEVDILQVLDLLQRRAHDQTRHEVRDAEVRLLFFDELPDLLLGYLLPNTVVDERMLDLDRIISGELQEGGYQQKHAQQVYPYVDNNLPAAILCLS